MENYPLYGEAGAALSPKMARRDKNIGLFLFLVFWGVKKLQIRRLISNAQCGGISASLPGENKRKSKSFQRGHFHAKQQCFN